MTDRGKINDAIIAWRNGQTYDAIHPLDRDDLSSVLWDDNALKDLARVIAHTLNGETPPEKPLPWNGVPRAGVYTYEAGPITEPGRYEWEPGPDGVTVRKVEERP